MRLIDADALMETLERGDWVHVTDYNIAIYAVKDAPTVDAVPVRHGWWITNKYNQTVCSECKSPALEVMTGCIVARHLEPYKTHFCPNCGTRMDGKENGNETD